MRIEKTDVLVIGSGGAGLRVAMELADNKIDVLVVGKCKIRDAHTILATGGINAALKNMDKKDSWQLHAADTIRDGEHINDSKAVEVLCKNAPAAVKELASWGTKFHREKDGRITQRFFGAATYRRACFAGDHTGREILNTLVNQTLKRKIKFKSELYITSLLTNNGKANGAIGIDMRSGNITAINAKIVVLCTGGYSRVFKRSSSRFWESTGDGIYLAYDAGAPCMDMEMFQFHPTGMIYPEKAEGVLVTEAVRGEGGILVNALGERFMKNYDPKRMELSARDIVARANYNEIKRGRGTAHKGVWLDITNKPRSYILKRLPKMYKQFKEYAGIDISKEMMEVAPTAHYSMGGVRVDYNTGKTAVPGLFAIGEVTAGLHGANRLGGNSLAELFVFGKLTAKTIIKELKKSFLLGLDGEMIKAKEQELKLMMRNRTGKNPADVKRQIQTIMWDSAGVVRNEKDMLLGLSKIRKLKRVKLYCGSQMRMNERLMAALDIKAMIPTCEMILESALYRRESRGAHYRSDYPKVLPNWKKNIICARINGKISISTKKVGPVKKSIAKLLTHRKAIHHLLE